MPSSKAKTFHGKGKGRSSILRQGWCCHIRRPCPLTRASKAGEAWQKERSESQTGDRLHKIF